MVDIKNITLEAALATVTEPSHSLTDAGIALWESRAGMLAAEREYNAAKSVFADWLESNPFAATVHDMAPFENHPVSAGKSLGAFLQWCVAMKMPGAAAAWKEAGDNMSSFAHPELVAKYLEVLGRLVMENGRGAVDATVAEYAAERLRAAMPSADSSRTWQAWHGEGGAIDRFLDAEPDACALVMLGHTLGYSLDDIQAQASEEYWEARGCREDAGYLSPPSATMADIQYDFRTALRSPKRAKAFVRDLLAVEWESSLEKLDGQHGNVIHLCNALYAARHPGGDGPWWVNGYRTAISTFGAETTFGAIAAGDAGLATAPHL